MLLNELFNNSPEIEIKQLSIDSRVPMKDCIFFCLSGIRDNGHDFVPEAIKNGANVIVYEDDDIDTSLNATYIKVSDVADCLNDIASKFYNYPANKMETYIVGGCDGKTSVNYILTKLIGYYKNVSSIGSNGIFYPEHHLLNKVPTLTILDNQKYLNEFVKKKINACIFEANALSLSYKKLDSIKPNVFIYTNTNKNSTDYEEIENNYFESIRRYFYSLDDSNIVLLNCDDVSYTDFKMSSGRNTFSYGFNSNSDYLICDVILKDSFSSFSIRTNKNVYKFKTKLLGLNNIYNLTAALAALSLMSYDLNELSKLVETIEPLGGVMNPINVGQNYNVLVDEARDINNVVAAIKYGYRITPENKKLFVVLGLDYSENKESVELLLNTMKNYVSHLFITEGNTYRGSVINEVKSVFSKFPEIKITIIEDRIIAIQSAIELLNSSDTLMLLGKGNDNYIVTNMGKQEYAGDIEIAKRMIKNRLNEENMLF